MQLFRINLERKWLGRITIAIYPLFRPGTTQESKIRVFPENAQREFHVIVQRMERAISGENLVHVHGLAMIIALMPWKARNP